MRSSWAMTLGLVWALTPSGAGAQPDISTVSLKGGTIQHVNQLIVSSTHHPRAWYPELEVGGRLAPSALQWGVYWGYWNDGVKTAVPLPDWVTYSYRSHVVGIRLLVFPLSELSFMPVHLGGIVGVSHDFLRRVHVGGSGFDGRRGQDGTQGMNSVDVGVRTGVTLWGPVQGIGEWHRFRQWGAKAGPSHRDAYQAGFTVSF